MSYKPKYLSANVILVAVIGCMTATLERKRMRKISSEKVVIHQMKYNIYIVYHRISELYLL